MSELVFRTANEDDLDRLVEIHTSAYPDPRGPEARRRNFLSNMLGSLSELHVAFDGARLVAHAFLFGLEVWFGGRAVRTAGIASVGVAPEARGQRIAARLLEHLHSASLERGDALALLYAFRQGFYARHGYAPVTPFRRLSLTPRALPKAWSMTPSGLVVRAAEGGDREGIEHAYQRAAARATGWITRPARMWDARLLDERRRWFVAMRAGHAVGFASWTVAQPEQHAPTRLVVYDLVADDDEARRALWGLVGAQRDQVNEVVVNVDANDPLDRALLDADAARFGDPDVEHVLGMLCGGPMVRMADAARALTARGYACDGALDLDVGGDRFRLEVHAGAASIGPTRATSAVTVDLTTLAAVAFGALAPSDAARLGWLVAPDPGTLRAADALFSLPPFFALDPF